TISGNGVGAPTGNNETAGVRLYGSANVADRNIVSANYGAGIAVPNGTAPVGIGNTITRNSIFDNGTITNAAGNPPTGQIGIDLHSPTDAEKTGTAPFVSLNDLNDQDAGGNGLLNFPYVDSAVISGSNLTVTAYARPGTSIELFKAQPDASGFGQGQQYLA